MLFGTAVVAASLSGCVTDRAAGPTPTSVVPSESATTTTSPTPTPSGTTATIAIPSDCRALLSDAVLAQLTDVPLNDPVFGPSGIQPDGSLTCIWAYPGADTTGLTTTISRVARGPALDMLNALAADEGFSCYTPDEGTRCEMTRQNPTYPEVTDGRTLYWRSGILIDTRYSNLAPTGYTSSIVAKLFA